ncbi:MAG: hypothetical protein FWH27_04545 [Planctomycetaceae bacterium]|nr:hypothetical protein [Planctomycetaceae bacterium]
MLYLFLIVYNYITLGAGVWSAIRHGEIMRNETKQNDSSLISDHLTSQVAGDSTVESSVDSEINHEFPSPVSTDMDVIDNQTRLGPSRGEEKMVANERLRLDSAKSLVAKPLFSGGMIEHLVGMVEDESGELAPLVTQLQEIYDMATEAQDNHYASEDAKFFITPDKECYATTTICRPLVGRKREEATGN